MRQGDKCFGQTVHPHPVPRKSLLMGKKLLEKTSIGRAAFIINSKCLVYFVHFVMHLTLDIYLQCKSFLQRTNSTDELCNS